ncbi:MAG: NCS2 family permease [Chthoniobacterales bacterium]
MLEQFFQLQKNGTTIRREVMAGLTTFAAMAYILAVNPSILSVTGMDRGALITATALASAIMTLAMALLTNYPLALAPGMGLNAFFAFTVCGAMKIPWQAALGMVFWGGVVFLLLSITGIRQKLVDAIPMELKLAITCGIGLFIAFIGLRNGGIIVGHPATLVGLGNFHQPSPWLVLGGLIFTAALVAKKVRGAVVLGILAVTIACLFAGITAHPSSLVAWPASLAPTFLKLDLSFLWTHSAVAIPIVLSFLFVDLFDNMGTLIGVCNRAGLLDRNGSLPKIGRAFTADASAAMIGSCLGTSTVTTYIESAAGVEEGARTGFSSVIVALCFLLALLLHPLIAIIPAVATAPALIIVGIFMMQGVLDIDLRDFSKAVPAVITMIAMPLTFSISEGIALGFLVYAGLKLCLGRAREVTPLAWILAALFLAHFIYQGVDAAT